MGTASLIIGILCFGAAMVPTSGYLTLIPATIGLILGIVCLAERVDRKAMAIGGTVLNALAIVLLFFWGAVIAFGVEGAVDLSAARLFHQPPPGSLPPVEQLDIIAPETPVTMPASAKTAAPAPAKAVAPAAAPAMPAAKTGGAGK
ncbi:MAG: hypothetical protein PHS41_01045 [Victivallaceae bacterium]|nr:hypothetical protein [Victivallaceae bacterium]